MLICKETVEDLAAIHALNRSVFGGDYEAELIDKLRSAQLVIVSLVAVDENEVIGHILFSKLAVKVNGNAVMAASLAPVAVKSDRQRQGIGSKLINEGLGEMRKQGIEAVIVLGHRDYYPRFGFSADKTANLTSPFHGWAEFMGLELVPGSLAGESGWIKYPEAFGLGEPK